MREQNWPNLKLFPEELWCLTQWHHTLLIRGIVRKFRERYKVIIVFYHNRSTPPPTHTRKCVLYFYGTEGPKCSFVTAFSATKFWFSQIILDKSGKFGAEFGIGEWNLSRKDVIILGLMIHWRRFVVNKRQQVTGGNTPTRSTDYPVELTISCASSTNLRAETRPVLSLSE